MNPSALLQSMWQEERSGVDNLMKRRRNGSSSCGLFSCESPHLNVPSKQAAEMCSLANVTAHQPTELEDPVDDEELSCILGSDLDPQ